MPRRPGVASRLGGHFLTFRFVISGRSQDLASHQPADKQAKQSDQISAAGTWVDRFWISALSRQRRSESQHDKCLPLARGKIHRRPTSPLKETQALEVF